MCIISVYGCKIEHTVAGHNRDILQQCIFDVLQPKYGASDRAKIAKYMLWSIETYLHTWKVK